MPSRLAALAVVALLVGGCATRLVPAPFAEPVPGRGVGAVGRDAGVAVTARVEAWTGWPPNLDTAVMPVLVTVDHDGTVPLLVRPHHFALVSFDQRFEARGPYDLDAIVHAPPPPGFAYPRVAFGAGFGLRRGWGLGFGLGAPLLGRDPFFGDDYYYPLQVAVRLPTGDMVQQALPETVLEPGGRITGFLYFERPRRYPEEMTFVADLVDARTGTPVGQVAIPFIAD
jgi:hypothetical protein